MGLAVWNHAEYRHRTALFEQESDCWIDAVLQKNTRNKRPALMHIPWCQLAFSEVSNSPKIFQFYRQLVSKSMMVTERQISSLSVNSGDRVSSPDNHRWEQTAVRCPTQHKNEPLALTTLWQYQPDSHALTLNLELLIWNKPHSSSANKSPVLMQSKNRRHSCHTVRKYFCKYGNND